MPPPSGYDQVGCVPCGGVVVILYLSLTRSDYEGSQNDSKIEVLRKALKIHIKADSQKFGKIGSCINSLRTSNSWLEFTL